MSPSKKWWLVIAAFLIANVIAAVGLAIFAHSDGESTVLPEWSEQK